MTFRRIDTRFPEVFLLEPQVHADERGFLVEAFRVDALAELGIDVAFVQENFSRSERGVLRGIHAQCGQSKLIRCSHGRIWDAVVDLRPDSPSFGEWDAYELDDASQRALFAPDGFGHGYCVLSDSADLSYLLSDYYDPARELTVAWDDPELGIEWPVPEPKLSERDRGAAPLRQAVGSELRPSSNP